MIRFVDDATTRRICAKEISVKKYVVRLSGDEREQLEVIGKERAGQRLLKAGFC